MYTELTKCVPGIEEHILQADKEQVLYIFEQASILHISHSSVDKSLVAW